MGGAATRIEPQVPDPLILLRSTKLPMGGCSRGDIRRRFAFMDEGSDSALIISREIGAIAVDVTHGAPPAGISAVTPLLCLGGHPAEECLLDVRGSGPNHDVVMSICDLAPDRVRLVERLAALLRPNVPYQVLVSRRAHEK